MTDAQEGFFTHSMLGSFSRPVSCCPGSDRASERHNAALTVPLKPPTSPAQSSSATAVATRQPVADGNPLADTISMGGAGPGRGGHARHAGQQWRQHHPPDGLQRIPAVMARATSPGRALTDVKARLAHYAQRQQPAVKNRPRSPLPQQSHSQSRDRDRLMPQQQQQQHRTHHRSPDGRMPVQRHSSPKRHSPPKVRMSSLRHFLSRFVVLCMGAATGVRNGAGVGGVSGEQERGFMSSWQIDLLLTLGSS